MRSTSSRCLAAITAAVLALTAACGSGDSSGSSDPGSGEKRTVQTPKGPVEVPAEPLRIVAIDFQIPYILLDLEAKLAGAIDLTAAKDGEPFRGLEIIGNDAGELNYEAIAKADPDLVIGGDYQEAEYDQLKDRYPTVLVPAVGDEPGWKPQVRAVAEAVNKTAKLNELEAEYQDRVTELKGEHGAKLTASKWATLGTYDGSGWYLYDKVGGPSTVLADLGIPFDEATTKVADGNVAQYSVEQLNQLSGAQVLLFDDLGPPVTAEGASAKLKADPLFTSLPAAQSAKVFDGQFNVIDYGDATRVLDRLDEILGQL
ncbi:ABC transporter substrate-binding protein [Actinokineospora pegani]|uniref:ABC transporter substrate-binding protein n=1 Tax=Actinokineospora pegani TaxID=2654637 RepID=UPI0012EAEBFD|nr:ABC transporter substrate-binding protein [Actinokineospora pegani]